MFAPHGFRGRRSDKGPDGASAQEGKRTERRQSAGLIKVRRTLRRIRLILPGEDRLQGGEDWNPKPGSAGGKVSEGDIRKPDCFGGSANGFRGLALQGRHEGRLRLSGQVFPTCSQHEAGGLRRWPAETKALCRREPGDGYE